MKMVVDIRFSKDSDRTVDSLRDLKKHKKLGKGVHCLYVFSACDLEIPYPFKRGKVLYIGETCRNKEPTGSRFSGSISRDLHKGNNFVSNRTLTCYYHAGYKLRLQVYVLECCNAVERKHAEAKLIKTHAKLFGAIPIGQGATGPSYTSTALNLLETTTGNTEALAL